MRILPFIKFSLRTLLCFIGCISCLVWIYLNTNSYSWNNVGQPYKDAPAEAKTWSWVLVPQDVYTDNGKIKKMFRTYYCQLTEDDYAFRCQRTENEEEMIYIARRNYPQGWWGHFYRIEVWLALLFLSCTIISLKKDRLLHKSAFVSN